VSKELVETHPKVLEQITKAIEAAVAHVPTTHEPLAADPVNRSAGIITSSSTKAAVLSGTVSLPPGPVGLLTIVPDLIGVWMIQQQMVADIAGAFGKQATLNQEQMLYCLFRHAASQGVRDLVVRVGERYLVRRASLKVLQNALEKIGFKVTQRLLGRTISRFLPIIGALAVAAYAFYDTHEVGKTAVELFSHDVDVEALPPAKEAAQVEA